MGKDRKPLGTLAVVALAALLFSAIALAVDVDAARGGRGGGGHTTATISVSPLVIANNGYITISGSGFGAGKGIQVGVSGYVPFYAVTTNSSGAFTFAYPRSVGGPCTCSAEAWGQSGGKFLMLASTSFNVSP